jgi:hypothetical protein
LPPDLLLQGVVLALDLQVHLRHLAAPLDHFAAQALALLPVEPLAQQPGDDGVAPGGVALSNSSRVS